VVDRPRKAQKRWEQNKGVCPAIVLYADAMTGDDRLGRLVRTVDFPTGPGIAHPTRARRTPGSDDYDRLMEVPQE
jgi:hypothetical protein